MNFSDDWTKYYELRLRSQCIALLLRFGFNRHRKYSYIGPPLSLILCLWFKFKIDRGNKALLISLYFLGWNKFFFRCCGFSFFQMTNCPQNMSKLTLQQTATKAYKRNIIHQHNNNKCPIIYNPLGVLILLFSPYICLLIGTTSKCSEQVMEKKKKMIEPEKRRRKQFGSLLHNSFKANSNK